MMMTMYCTVCTLDALILISGRSIVLACRHAFDICLFWSNVKAWCENYHMFHCNGKKINKQIKTILSKQSRCNRIFAFLCTLN